MNNTSGIYKITCLKDNRFYIGSSIYIDRRLKTHKRLLRKNDHDNKYLQGAWTKYGEKNFRFEIIETVHDISQLLIREEWWLTHTNCYNRKIGFNISSSPRSQGIGRFIDLTGQKFNKLTAIECVGKNKSGNYRWLCKCFCGKTAIVAGGNLKNGHTQSCGCLKNNGNSNLKHGYTKNGEKPKIYNIWSSMIQRCTDKNSKNYKDYGGRDKSPIKVCYRWSNKNPKGFENFYKDVGDPPEGKSLDRVNNDKGYFPNNWKWSTRKEQARNRRSSCMVMLNGKIQLLIKISEDYNIPYKILWERIYKYGWSIEKALTTPIRSRSQY